MSLVPGPVVLFVESIDENDEVFTYTTNISVAQYVRLFINVLFNCNNIPINNIRENKITSLTITQGNNIHTVNVTVIDERVLSTFNVGSIVTNSGSNSYLENVPTITITFNQ